MPGYPEKCTLRVASSCDNKTADDLNRSGGHFLTTLGISAACLRMRRLFVELDPSMDSLCSIRAPEGIAPRALLR